jgi:Urease, gamma subunit
MKLTPQEFDKLKLCNAGYVAQRRLARGLRLVSQFIQFDSCRLSLFFLLSLHPVFALFDGYTIVS